MPKVNIGTCTTLFQLTSLGADELKVAELVGVQPGILSKKATGLTVKMVNIII